MSRTFNIPWQSRWPPKLEAGLDTACELALEALRPDSLDARAFAELGFARLYKKRHDESLAAYERAMKLNPNDADTLARAYAVSCSGGPRRALDLLARAMRLDPYYPDCYLWHLGDAHFDLGDYEQTVCALKEMRDQSEGAPPPGCQLRPSGPGQGSALPRREDTGGRPELLDRALAHGIARPGPRARPAADCGAAQSGSARGLRSSRTSAGESRAASGRGLAN